MEQMHPSDYRRSAVILYILTACFWFAQYTCTPYLNPEMINMGASESFMGLVAGAYGLTQLVLRVPLGIVADRAGVQKPIIIIGCALVVTSAAGMLLFYSPMGFFLFRGVAGFASASWISLTVLYGSYFPPEETPRRISQVNSANHLGRLLCFLVVGALVTRFSVKAAFYAGLATSLLALGMSFFVQDVPRAKKHIGLKDFLSVANDRNLKVTSLLGMLIQTISFGTYYTFTPNLAVALNATASGLSYLNIALMLPMVLGNFVATKWLYRKVGPVRLIIVGFLLTGVYCVLAPMARSMTELYLCQVLAGVSFSLTFTILMGQCVRTVPIDSRSIGMGIYQAVYGIGMTIGPVLMGYLIEWAGIKSAFFMVAVLAVASAGLTLALMRDDYNTNSKH